ncbi:hypothetical protein BSP4_30990 [Bacillus subtilis subsp. subtilis]|nr:hypothetical protein BSP4_30990 [Bacillus subtilis subsp. subtilis]CAF1784384.1 hypothetical protein NRS6108_04067 [Bacillus subtilis]
MGRPELSKVCQRCKQDKPLSEYYNNKTKPDYRNGICKKCQKEVNA